jgi:hypothetical protein
LDTWSQQYAYSSTLESSINMKTKWFWSLVIVWAFALIIISFGINSVLADRITRIQINNPFRISMSLEVKCDHNWKLNKYNYYQVINIPKKSNTVIAVPASMKYCEIWPIRVKLF